MTQAPSLISVPDEVVLEDEDYDLNTNRFHLPVAVDSDMEYLNMGGSTSVEQVRP